MSTFTMVARMVAKPDRGEALKAELSKLVAPTRAEDGCLRYDLHQSLDEPRAFLFFEDWESEAHWRAHCDTPHFLAHRAATRDYVEMAELLRVESF